MQWNDIPPREQRRAIVLQRYRIRITSGIICMVAVIPLTLWWIPAGVLAWFLGVFALGYATGWLLHDEISLGAPPAALENSERRFYELFAFLVLLAAFITTAGGMMYLLRYSAWAQEQVMSQFRQLLS